MNLLNELTSEIITNLDKQIEDQKQLVKRTETNVLLSLLGKSPVVYSVRQQFTYLSVCKHTLAEMESLSKQIKESQPCSPIGKDENTHG